MNFVIHKSPACGPSLPFIGFEGLIAYDIACGDPLKDMIEKYCLAGGIDVRGMGAP